MRLKIGRCLLVGLLVLSAVGSTAVATDPRSNTGVQETTCSFPTALTDATGTEVQLESEPTRIVTLNPSAAQTVWEIGAREKVVGLTKYASNLDGATTRTNVSTAEDIVSVEQVVGLEPDLVLAPNATSRETIRKLRDTGVTVYHFSEARTLADIQRKVETTGQLVGACDAAAARAERMDRRLGVVSEAVDGQERPDVLYSFYGYTAGEGTFIDTIIETAGGTNVAADANITGYKPVNSEFVVESDPDWIVRNSDTPTVPATDAYNSTTAVESGQVVVVNIDYLNRPAPRVVNAVTKLARAFHPEAYAAANATATPTPTVTDSSPTVTSTASATATAASTTATTDTETTAVTTPGFGLPSALLTLVALLLVASRYR